MKIAFFADNFYPELSGIADTILLTGGELARRGHEVHCFVPAYSHADYKIVGLPHGELAMPPGLHIRRMLSVRYATATRQGRAVIPHLFRGVLSRERFDIIHTHSFFGPGIDALLAARIKGIPLVGTNHTLIEEFVRYWPVRGPWARRRMAAYVAWYYNHCREMSVPSQYLADHMRARGLRVPVSVISNPVASDFFTPRASRQILKRELGFRPFTILYAGRLSPEKDIDTLVKGFMEFAAHTSEAGLVIVGQGSSRSQLEEEVRATGMSDRIRFMGPFLGGQKKILYDIFHACDVSVTASTSETQCMSIMQGMASGMPVVAARATALPEYVSSERGFLFEPGRQEELASHLQKLFADPVLRANMGKKGVNFAQTLSVPTVADTWEDFYHRVLYK